MNAFGSAEKSVQEAGHEKEGQHEAEDPFDEDLDTGISASSPTMSVLMILLH